MFEKKLIIGCFSEKRVLPQKVAMETLSPDLTTLPTIFRQNPFFPQKAEKLPPGRAPRSEKTIKLNIFPGIKNFPGEVYLDR